MKKNLVIGIVAVVIVALLAGGFLFWKSGEKASDMPSGAKKSEQAADSQSDEGGLLDTAEKIKNAMLGGKKMECVFKDDAGDGKQVEMKLQSQGEKFRSSYMVNGEEFVSVSDGKVVYSWSSKTKEGQKMDLECMEDLSEDTPQAQGTAEGQIDYTEPEELVDEQPDMKCSPILSIDLSVPEDVKFSDYCAEMKKLLDSMKDLNVNLPQGVNIPQLQQ